MATAKQIAARKRFAEMAKSGALARVRRKAKKNPTPKAAAPKKRPAAPSRRKSNPSPKKRVQTPRGGCNPVYAVQVKRGGRWVTVARESSQAAAESTARTLHSLGITVPVRVWD